MRVLRWCLAVRCLLNASYLFLAHVETARQKPDMMSYLTLLYKFASVWNEWSRQLRAATAENLWSCWGRQTRLEAVDSQRRLLFVIKLHLFLSLFVVTGLLSCSVVMVWFISSSSFQLPHQEAIASTMFECSRSRLSHYEPCQEDWHRKFLMYV